jgi:D-galacturonate reductase
MMLFFNGEKDGGYLEHIDSMRGVKHSFIVKGNQPGDSYYNETNPDYFQMVNVGGKGLKPVGYGFRSIEFILNAMTRVNDETKGLGAKDKIKKSQDLLRQYDEDGVMATPKNSAYNELVMEAGRLSITHGGRDAVIEYGKAPKVRFKEPGEYKKIA